MTSDSILWRTAAGHIHEKTGLVVDAENLRKNVGLMDVIHIYPLVMTNSLPWFFDGP